MNQPSKRIAERFKDDFPAINTKEQLIAIAITQWLKEQPENNLPEFWYSDYKFEDFGSAELNNLMATIQLLQAENYELKEKLRINPDAAMQKTSTLEQVEAVAREAFSTGIQAYCGDMGDGWDFDMDFWQNKKQEMEK